MKYLVIERIVCQRPPEIYKKESNYLAWVRLTGLLENSGQTWNDIDQVYQFCEKRVPLTGKMKELEVVGLYLQGKPGKTDYKFVNGLDFLVPVPNVLKEISTFMKGGWDVGY
ncbi:MAG: hypothetical protein ACI4T5_06025 [Prevotella sp.]